MKINKIKPIPKYILALIKREDKKHYKEPTGKTRYYSYLTKNDGELACITVAVKHHYKKWYCKQGVVHGLHSETCFVKDIALHYIAGYITGCTQREFQNAKRNLKTATGIRLKINFSI